MSDVRRCEAAIYVRDTYRRTGRGKSGFEMHYTKKQCSRAAVSDGFCTQHHRRAAWGWQERLDWHPYLDPRQ